MADFLLPVGPARNLFAEPGVSCVGPFKMIPDVLHGMFFNFGV